MEVIKVCIVFVVSLIAYKISDIDFVGNVFLFGGRTDAIQRIFQNTKDNLTLY